MHQSIPDAPMPLRGKPQALAFFFFLDGKFLGEECLKSQLPCSGNKNRRASTPPIGRPQGHLLSLLWSFCWPGVFIMGATASTTVSSLFTRKTNNYVL